MSSAPFVLASRSAIRVKLLRDAGLSFDTDAADVDEDAIGASHRDPRDRAMTLAKAKALAVSARQPGLVVLGADQVGVVGTPAGEAFLEKPRDDDDHLRMLLAMAGRTHTFHPAAVLVKDGRVLEEIADAVAVTFRPFDEKTARAYVATGEGKSSCGGYESEHRGAQLIGRVDGNLHSVLGLPLLAVLDGLRRAVPAAFL